MAIEMNILNQNDCAKITNGFFIGKFKFTKLSINSNTILKNEIFLAIKGKNLDGHDYVNQAFKNGAQAAIVNEQFYNLHKDRYKDNNLLVVKDTYKALVDIANFKRTTFKGKVVAITGSMGKTTLKEMLVCCLSKYYKVHYTVGNYNNHIGLPLCLSNLDNSYDISVLELGMSSEGEISFLSNLVKPHIATITEVTAAHLEFFSSIDDILKAKLEILEGLSPQSCFFINKSSLYFKKVYESLKERNLKNIIYFNDESVSEESTVILSYEVLFKNYKNFQTIVKANIQNEEISYVLNSIYDHNIMLSCLALSIGKTLKCPMDNLIEGIKSFSPLTGRGNLFNLKLNTHDVLVINDSYNANYKSMTAAILATNRIKGYNKILILGEMLELGDFSNTLHEKLYEPISNSNSDLVLLLGSNMKNLYKLLNTKINVFLSMSWNEAYDILLNEIKDNSLILLKGSNSSGIYNIANSLLCNKK